MEACKESISLYCISILCPEHMLNKLWLDSRDKTVCTTAIYTQLISCPIRKFQYLGLMQWCSFIIVLVFFAHSIQHAPTALTHKYCVFKHWKVTLRQAIVKWVKLLKSSGVFSFGWFHFLKCGGLIVSVPGSSGCWCFSAFNRGTLWHSYSRDGPDINTTAAVLHCCITQS